MAVMNVLGCACVVVSNLTPEEIELCEVMDPDALKLEGETGAEFRISVDEGPGRLIDEEAVFSRVKTADGKATITMLLDPEMEDRDKTIMKALGSALTKLDALEKRLVLCEAGAADMENRMIALMSDQ